HGDAVNSAEVSPDARYVITIPRDNTVKIYDLYTKQQKDFLDNGKKLREDRIMYSSIDILRLRQEERRQEERRQQEELRIQHLKNTAQKVLKYSACVAGAYGLYKWFTKK
ncbi:hypothetical protein K9K77_02575, partial [Candidatus Babeliales bacterium]|nr:hypothetical protein [Candidatus Babeliales bacterium]